MRHEPIVARIAHGGVQETVDHQRAGGLVHLVFDRLAADWDLDDDVDVLGRVVTDRDGIKTHVLLRWAAVRRITTTDEHRSPPGAGSKRSASTDLPATGPARSPKIRTANPHPTIATKLKGNTVIAWLRTIVENPNTERVIMSLIIINATVLGLETSQEVMATSGPVLEIIDHVLLAIFVAELAARIIVHRLDFFRDPWSLFDFLVIGIALVPATENFTVLRALRILRVLRLITAIPTLKRVVAGLLASLPGMGSILFLIGLIYYMFSVMGTKLFGATNPELFGTLGRTLYTLFTVMTLEGWTNDVAKPVMEHHPYGWIYLFAFIIVATFMVLNLFIGVVVNSMQAEAMKAEEAERVIVHEEAAPILAEVKSMRQELAALRAEMAGRKAG